MTDLGSIGPSVDDIRRGELWWVDLVSEPRGSAPGFRRPVIVVQDDHFNQSSLATIIVVVVTSNLVLADLPGNVFLPRRETRLKRDSVANVTALITVDRVFFRMPGIALSKLSTRTMKLVDEGIALVLSL